ncbi:flavodoxin family protein [Williamsia maris]|uniref:Flavodoxin n=1 Tax=Williamsia maris TaxID=72806 RepID=A0ABT1H8K2_9NOCA|nr:flavodoxin family protein [Williamsia maris]MCP2174592.1 Flavodoxin [Williamsia maris]
MKTLVVCASRSSHQNTRRIADALGGALDADVVTPDEVTPAMLAEADRIGVGSGIYWMSFDPRLMEWVRGLTDMSGRDAFIFSTSGLPETALRRYTNTFEQLLRQRGFRYLGAFGCRGLDTWGPFGLIGGVSRGRPDADDLAAAQSFAAGLRR